jgi:hypothetical protein
MNKAVTIAIIYLKGISCAVLCFYALETEAIKIIFESCSQAELSLRLKRHRIKKILVTTILNLILFAYAVAFSFK